MFVFVGISSTPTGGHAGITKTLHCLQAKVYSSGMKRDVENSFTSYNTCQRSKNIPQASLGLLQMIPPPNAVWEYV